MGLAPGGWVAPQAPAKDVSTLSIRSDHSFSLPQISFVDFMMYEMLDQHLRLESTCLQDAKNLQEFVKRFEALEPIKKYMASPRFLKWPLNNKMAKFGGN